ncbi:pyruvate kinase [Sporomusaceae bacterium BoRhaA]|uniref:pyruvate kinase alpha/beta domain-containing protein n=1 Tax=Pelorhabdus rhamnosifermentans TaxID=2772457 RepID=UPI0028A97537|nr:pyruvate kinase alpha/beta domain-containing protein [Pelorhabdus rhamnosifermentans]MBU2699332.1 pyruvate kinase [Pelorhabdus rhamnosifermentans]
MVTVDEAWNIKAFKRLLAAGIDGIILRTSDSGQWNKKLRAVRQAVNDLGTTLPILAEILPGTDIVNEIKLAIIANVDAIIVRPASGTEALLEARRMIEEQGVSTAVFARLSSPEDTEDILRVTDGSIIDFPCPSGSTRDALTNILRQGAATGKLIFLAAKTAELQGSNEKYRELVSLADSWQFDGVALSSDGTNPDHLANVIHLLRIKAREIEEERNTLRHEQCLGRIVASPLANALCSTALHAAVAVKAIAFIVPSQTGFLPRLLSKFRPAVPVLAVTPDTRVARRLKLAWGIWPLLTLRPLRQDDVMDVAIRTAMRSEFIGDGDLIVGVTSSTDIVTAANTVTLSVVGDVILRGQGIGDGIISGRVTIIKSLYNTKKSVANKIVVIPATEATHVKLINQAAALVVEEGGLSSHAAIACLTLNKPAIVGATDATDLLLEDEQVTLDISRGMVYRGWVNL